MHAKRQGRVRVFVALAVCIAVMMTACSTTWITQAEQIVAVLIPAASNLVALVSALEGKSVSTADLQMIQNAGTQAGAGLQLIQSLITQYENADAAAKPGILSQIQTAINTVQANLNALLPALHIKDAATQAKVTAVVGILLSEVQSLAAMVPLANASASAEMRAKAAGEAKKRPPLSASEFVKSYNATMKAKTGNSDLDRAASGMEIHRHGKLARWATAGILK
jgi:hypothetical protein